MTNMTPQLTEIVRNSALAHAIRRRLPDGRLKASLPINTGKIWQQRLHPQRQLKLSEFCWREIAQLYNFLLISRQCPTDDASFKNNIHGSNLVPIGIGRSEMGATIDT